MKYSAGEIAEIRKITVQQYFNRFKPDMLEELSSNGRYKVTVDGEEHFSLAIYPSGSWAFFSKGETGVGALDWLMKIEGLSFSAACHVLVGPAREALKEEERGEAIREHRTKLYGKDEVQMGKPVERKSFVPPQIAVDCDEHIRYLVNRGIDKDIVEYCTERKIIYTEANQHDVVFAGFDEHQRMRSAARRATKNRINPNVPVKYDVTGSDKKYSFAVNLNSIRNTVHFFEGPVDALAYATYLKDHGAEWRLENILSVNGIVKSQTSNLPAVISRFLGENGKNIKTVYLHFDNDLAGKTAMLNYKKTLTDLGYNVVLAPPPFNKDWAEYNYDLRERSKGHERSLFKTDTTDT